MKRLKTEPGRLTVMLLIGGMTLLGAWAFRTASVGSAAQIPHDADPDGGVARAAERGKFAVVHFAAAEAPGARDAYDSLRKAHRQWANEAVLVTVDLDQPGASRLPGTYGVEQGPATLVLAPNGAVTAAYQGAVSADDLAKAFVSKGMTQVIGALQKQKTVFAVFSETGATHAKEALATARETAAELDGLAEVVPVDASQETERELAENCGLKLPLKAARTVVVAPSGAIVKTFAGETSSRDLLDSFQLVLSQPSGCGAATATGGSSCSPGAGVAGQGGCG